MGYSGAGWKLIDEINQKQKISWHCPFKHVEKDLIVYINNLHLVNRLQL